MWGQDRRVIFYHPCWCFHGVFKGLAHLEIAYQYSISKKPVYRDDFRGSADIITTDRITSFGIETSR